MYKSKKLDLAKIDGFEWDEGNIDKNREKHGVDVEECQEIFFNQPLFFFDDPGHSMTEKRYGALGVSSNGRKLAVFFTIRNGKIRVISARDQGKRDREFFKKVKKMEVKKDEE